MHLNKRKSVILFLASVYFFLIEAQEPTLKEITERECSSDKPFKCLPYGVCYNADQFCHAGTVESCFPKNVTTDQLENWCKTTGQFRPELMRDPKLCALSCQARFPSLNLSNGHAGKYWRDVSIGVSVPLGIAVVFIFGLGCFLIRRSCCKEKSNDNLAPGENHKANPPDGNTTEMIQLRPGHTDDTSITHKGILNHQTPPNGQCDDARLRRAQSGTTNGQTAPNGQDALAGQAPPMFRQHPMVRQHPMARMH
ncbi:uncharacterized protein LOC131949447 [Physella acuta]|uniref:uncharacterized protein LOC131949447 n=1 Tax=Physella acuta TaxID=109671 RepID=UPI0027DB1F88|nr:uncharacterized protein LOC131949447 [Physella acuta]